MKKLNCSLKEASVSAVIWLSMYTSELCKEDFSVLILTTNIDMKADMNYTPFCYLIFVAL